MSKTTPGGLYRNPDGTYKNAQGERVETPKPKKAASKK